MVGKTDLSTDNFKRPSQYFDISLLITQWDKLSISELAIDHDCPQVAARSHISCDVEFVIIRHNFTRNRTGSRLHTQHWSNILLPDGLPLLRQDMERDRVVLRVVNQGSYSFSKE